MGEEERWKSHSLPLRELERGVFRLVFVFVLKIADKSAQTVCSWGKVTVVGEEESWKRHPLPNQRSYVLPPHFMNTPFAAQHADC